MKSLIAYTLVIFVKALLNYQANKIIMQPYPCITSLFLMDGVLWPIRRLKMALKLCSECLQFFSPKSKLLEANYLELTFICTTITQS